VGHGDGDDDDGDDDDGDDDDDDDDDDYCDDGDDDDDDDDDDLAPGDSLGGLTRLVRLHLGQNRFTGPLPLEDGLEKLKELEVLGLSANAFTGINISNNLKAQYEGSNVVTTLPPSRCRSHHIVICHHHHHDPHQSSLLLVPGPIPEGLTRLSRLKTLQLSHNQLTGAIPPSLLAMITLRELHLGFNPLDHEPALEALMLQLRQDKPRCAVFW
jgi:Leucine-rich repeat (LRR) protein